MARSGYWLMEYVSISRLLRKAPSKYARAYLHTETDANDATYFVAHQVDIIERAIHDLHQYLARKSQEMKSAERLLGRLDLNHRQIALLGHALRNPEQDYSVASHKRSHRVTQQTARTDLAALARMGLLDPVKRGRAFIYYPAPNMRELLEEIGRSSRATAGD